MSKSNPRFKNLKYMTTWKIREILSTHYTSGVDGQDYEPVREELEVILFERENNESEAKVREYQSNLREHERYLAEERRKERLMRKRIVEIT